MKQRYAGRDGFEESRGQRSLFGYRFPMNRRGFTLIELLIVVVIIGILASVAIPKFSSTKGKAYLATMKSDLKNFASAQESYYYEHSAYYNGGVPNAAISFSPSSGVNITITAADVAGWAATATHSIVPNTCSIFVGSAAAPAPATVEGAPACN
jgi:prepilin-type N-terminal cleavage/methylation domain-containing protein